RPPDHSPTGTPGPEGSSGEQAAGGITQAVQTDPAGGGERRLRFITGVRPSDARPSMRMADPARCARLSGSLNHRSRREYSHALTPSGKPAATGSGERKTTTARRPDAIPGQHQPQVLLR